MDLHRTCEAQRALHAGFCGRVSTNVVCTGYVRGCQLAQHQRKVAVKFADAEQVGVNVVVDGAGVAVKLSNVTIARVQKTLQ